MSLPEFLNMTILYWDQIRDIVNLLILVAGLIFAYYKFGLRREGKVFLNLDIDAEIIDREDDLILVSLAVTMENAGDTLIITRKFEDLGHNSEFLHPDEYDPQKYAGTLKIRKLPSNNGEPLLFDWYSLPKVDNIKRLDKLVGNRYEDLDQINFLHDYFIPHSKNKDTYFYLEPKERNTSHVFLWLPSDVYVIRAVFLSRTYSDVETDYWNVTKIFSFK